MREAIGCQSSHVLLLLEVLSCSQKIAGRLVRESAIRDGQVRTSFRRQRRLLGLLVLARLGAFWRARCSYILPAKLLADLLDFKRVI